MNKVNTNVSYDKGIIRGAYYPHIDGLRAFAILSVLLYHAFPAMCPGGYMGVDVFFVISGYLITKGLLKDLKKGEYSIGTFYARRIRRIFPAYVLAVLFALFVGFLLYYGMRTNILAKTVFSSIAFVSNIYFSLNSGYFSPNAHENPLLNMWSLSVEEQFYVFFPLFLAAIHKWLPRYVKIASWTLFVFSLVPCIIFVNFFGKTTMAFYHLPFRSWELLAGCLLAIHCEERFLHLGWNIFILIALNVIFFFTSPSIVFPGYYAILPVACAAVLLISGQSGMVKCVLENKLLVFIGKISYPLYLFHWPVLVFLRTFKGELMSPIFADILAVVLSFILSIVSWKFVELPIRRTRWSNVRYFRFAGLVFLIVGTSTFALHSLSKHQLDNPVFEVGSYWSGAAVKADESGDIKLVSLGAENDSRYCIWGDSHARALAPGFNYFSEQTGLNGIYIENRATLHAHTNYKGSFVVNDNAAGIEQVLQFLQGRQDITTVVLINRWACAMNGTWNETSGTWYPVRTDGKTGSHEELFELGLREICIRLREMNKRVVIISSVPEQGRDVPINLGRFASLTGKPYAGRGVSLELFEEREKAVYGCFKRLESESLATVVDIKDIFYPNGKSASLLISGNASLYLDDDHLSQTGAIYVISKLQDRLQKLIMEPEAIGKSEERP